MADVSFMISYTQTHISEQSDTYAAYTMDIVDMSYRYMLRSVSRILFQFEYMI